jgi:origin recognition complex subunit 2
VNSSSESSDQSEPEEEEVLEVEELQEASHELFFKDTKISKSSTSNNVLEFAHIDPKEYAAALKVLPKHHEPCLKRLREQYVDMFGQWKFELESGLQLLFYGFGSKRNLLNRFVDEKLDCGPSVSVHGYFPSVSLKTILSNVITQVFDESGSGSSVMILAQRVLDLLMKSDYPYITFIIHNIEGKGLANDACQKAIALLASCEKVYVIASCDHLNTALLWDHSKLSQLRFAWHDLTTFEPYLTETSFENSILGKANQKTGQGIIHVLRSLSSNVRLMFMELVRHQLNEMNEKGIAESKDGLTFDQLFRQCQDRFLVNSLVAFQTALTEFKDHECIFSTSVDGVECLHIPVTKADLEDITEQVKTL